MATYVNIRLAPDEVASIKDAIAALTELQRLSPLYHSKTRLPILDGRDLLMTTEVISRNTILDYLEHQEPSLASLRAAARVRIDLGLPPRG
jgi:hypothetical protein